MITKDWPKLDGQAQENIRVSCLFFLIDCGSSKRTHNGIVWANIIYFQPGL